MTPLHFWEQSKEFQGQIHFSEFRVEPYATLERLTGLIYEKFGNAISQCHVTRTYIPVTIVVCWSCTELRTPINKNGDMGVIRPIEGPSIHEFHDPAAGRARWNACRDAVKRLRKLTRFFQGVVVVFNGNSESHGLDSPGVHAHNEMLPVEKHATFEGLAFIVNQELQDGGVMTCPSAGENGLIAKAIRESPQGETPYASRSS